MKDHVLAKRTSMETQGFGKESRKEACLKGLNMVPLCTEGSQGWGEYPKLCRMPGCQRPSGSFQCACRPSGHGFHPAKGCECHLHSRSGL